MKRSLLHVSPVIPAKAGNEITRTRIPQHAEGGKVSASARNARKNASIKSGEEHRPSPLSPSSWLL